MIINNPKVYVTLWYTMTGLIIAMVYSVIIFADFLYSPLIATLTSGFWGALLVKNGLKKLAE